MEQAANFNFKTIFLILSISKYFSFLEDGSPDITLLLEDYNFIDSIVAEDLRLYFLSYSEYYFITSDYFEFPYISLHNYL